MLNKAMLIGNLGKDVESRDTPSGQTVANFSIATNRKWKDKDGNRQEETEWHSIVAWGKLADICIRYLKKGSKVYIEGRICTRSWHDQEGGQKRYRTEIIANEMKMLGGDRNASTDGADDGIPF